MGTWNPVSPSARVVQHHFVNARVSELNRSEGPQLRKDTIELFRNDETLAPRLKGYSASKKQAYCEDAFDRLTRILQSRQLTINFHADRWFTKENTYETYAQMYERGIKNGRMILDDSDDDNPAEVRTAADDRVTFPKHWSAAAAPSHRGLMPGAVQSPKAIMNRMMAGRKIVPYGGDTTGVLNPVPNTDSKSRGYESPNPRFDPRTKQVFAGVNYGRRPHGSSTNYGNSYIVLNPNLGVDAIYFPSDTFDLPGANKQVSYQLLAAIYFKAGKHMRQEIVKSCFDGNRLPDSANGKDLMEAHIFQPVRFSSHVTEMYLETSPPGIMRNAKRFCDKWGIKLMINLA
ncbi:MAG TPA: hypothetical protein VFU68_07355 [Terracidiphilus sp.]|nr:hypothetical protein [Terracidiphilus sp.]